MRKYPKKAPAGPPPIIATREPVSREKPGEAAVSFRGAGFDALTAYLLRIF
jgi:hypothetical protein